MQRSQCQYCIHFHQHYSLNSQRCTAVHCGHCTYPRIKHRKPDTPACAYFQEYTARDLPNHQEVIHYLTTEFLEEILKLQLPPEIVTADEGSE